MKRYLSVLLVAGLLATATPATATADDDPRTLYVATNGDDHNPGSFGRPLRTLEGARDAIRTIKKHHLPDGGVTVYLRQGSYQRSSTFALTAEDSGTADAPITYRSYPGETATLTGGTQLSYDDFHQVTDQSVLDRVVEKSARGKILQVDLRGLGLTDYGELSRHGYWHANDVSKTPPMELYVDGQDMTLARWPNTGTVQMNKIIDPGPTHNDPDLQDRGGTFSYSYDRPRYWTQAKDVWLDGIFGYSWEWSYNKIQSIDTAAKTITLRYGEMSGLMKSWFPDFHFAQNLLEELDAPGEYYIDRDRGVLYLVPNASFLARRGAVTVTTLEEPMVRTDGTSYVTFDDLVMEYGRATAAVILGGSHVTIAHSDIRNFTDGGVLINSPGRYTYDGIPVNRGGTDHAVVSSELSHIGGVPIVLQGGDKTTLAPGRNKVENSHIHDFAYYHKAYNAGVMFDGVGNIARGNEIHDAPHPGIIVQGNDQLVEDNEIYDVCKTFQDLGAIYMNAGSTPQQRGNVFRRNYFHDIGKGRAGVEGIYADNLTMGITIDQNVFADMGNDAVKSGSGDYVTATNNVFVDTHVPYDNYEMWMGNQEGNVVDRSYMPAWKKLFADNDNFVGTPYLTKYPELAHFFDDNHYYPAHNTYAKNVVWNPTTTRQSDVNAQGARDVKNLLNYDGNWVASEDPGFVDWQKGDFRLRPDAAVFQHIPGFQPIAFDRIGTHGHIGQSRTPEVVPLESVAFPAEDLSIDLGKQTSFAGAVVPWNTTQPGLAYASSDPTIATVDADGLVTGVAPGTATLTVTSAANPAIKDEATVVVHEGDGVLHYTDFESGANGWPVDANRSVVDDGTGNHVYRIVKGANSQLPRDFTQYVLDFTVTTPATLPDGAVMLVYDRTGATPGGFVRYRHLASGPVWTIYDSKWQVVQEVTLGADAAFTPNTTYPIKVAVRPTGITVGVNGRQVVAGRNPAPEAAGKVGFYVSGASRLDFDNVGFSIVSHEVTGVDLGTAQLALETGERRTVAATVTPADASDTRLAWTSDNPAVATVDSTGRVTAVAAGTANVTATSVSNPAVSATVAVTVQDGQYAVTDLTTQLSDQANWTTSPNLDFSTGTVKATGEGVYGYKGQKFGDGLLRFKAEVGAFAGGWYGFQVRSHDTGVPAWQNSNTGYLVVIKEDTIEFQSWTPGQTMLDVIPNTVIAPNSTHEIAFGAVGNRVVLRVDGRTVWTDVVTVPNNPIGADGYFNLYNYLKGNPVRLLTV
ncbi:MULTISPECIES: Ig-like domain-containing protein [Kribbella]|uniref:BIG2 domain-containing protein n=1 Tax=Kribbella karoonensis TaxID=324851 RepID=A0ABN2EHP0_9ACTN